MIEIGKPEHSKVTTCAYCGVGCSFKAEMRGEEVVRMVPYKNGEANRGHSCVKGPLRLRLCDPQGSHPETDDPQQHPGSVEGSFLDEAYAYAASEFKRIQAKYGKRSVGGITSSRCSNEETYLVQKLVRGGFGVNNVDTCARVCHSPTVYGLGQTYGTSAGTQNFDSDEFSDVIMVIGANPAAGHPVFASRMKKRIRQGAKLIVLDPRRTETVRSAHIEADFHLPLRPGTNAAILTSLAHVIVTEGLVNEKFVQERCDLEAFAEVEGFRRAAEAQPGRSIEVHRRARGSDPRRGAAIRHPAGTARSITASASPSTARVRPPSWRSRISRWRPAISAARASA